MKLSHAIVIGLAVGVLSAIAAIAYVAPPRPGQVTVAAAPIEQAAEPPKTESVRHTTPAKNRAASAPAPAAKIEPARTAPPAAPTAVAVSAPQPVDACSLSRPPQSMTTNTESDAFISPRADAPLNVLGAGRRLRVLTRDGQWLLVQFSEGDLAASDPHAGPFRQRQAFVHCANLSATASADGF